MKRILVTGGAGYIGSHIVQKLRKAGFETLVFDNLSTGCRDVVQGPMVVGDLLDTIPLEGIHAVMHLAARTNVGESVAHPELYYQTNVVGTLRLLEAMQRAGCRKFIFSSTAAIFGWPQALTINEKHPLEPINPYGRTKLIDEQMIRDFGIDAISLRYFNAAGGDPTGMIKQPKPKTNNLIPILLQGLKTGRTATIFGTDYDTPDGTCVRDYIHVEDIATAHLLALEKVLQKEGLSCYNLGNGRGFSVREVIHTVEQVTGRKLSIVEGARRPGDPPYLVADGTCAQHELGWTPRYPELRDMIADAWKALS